MSLFLFVHQSAVWVAFTALVLSAAAPAQALSGPECLRQSYPAFWAPQGSAASDQTLVSFAGLRFEFDQHKDHLSHAQLLNQADLKTQLAQPYAAGFPATPPLRNQDPGRMRDQAFFVALYGATPTEVQRHLVTVPWAPNGRSLAFTRLNGAAQALERVGRTLAQEAATAAYVRQPTGSFYWRRIAGAPRLSAHAFGAAVDFALPHGLGRYWQWSGCTEEGACTYPAAVLKDPTLQRVVTAFEQEGFIWGGKWAHFDTVHFEYRPELVGPACQR
jgi:hypothetical protein